MIDSGSKLILWSTTQARTIEHSLVLQRQRVQSLSSQLAALDPQATLGRGYAMVQKGQRIVTQTGQVEQGDDIVVQVSDGEFGATVNES